MNSIKWICKNYNCVTTNHLLDFPFFHSDQEFLHLSIWYRVHIGKIVQKVTLLQISFRYVSKSVAFQMLSDIKRVLKYSFQVWTKTLSGIQFVALRTAIRYNVNVFLEITSMLGAGGLVSEFMWCIL